MILSGFAIFSAWNLISFKNFDFCHFGLSGTGILK